MPICLRFPSTGLLYSGVLHKYNTITDKMQAFFKYFLKIFLLFMLYCSESQYLCVFPQVMMNIFWVKYFFSRNVFLTHADAGRIFLRFLI